MAPTHRCIRVFPLAGLPRYTETCSSARRNLSARAASEKSSESTSSLDEESRLEALERGVRRKQGMCDDFVLIAAASYNLISQIGTCQEWHNLIRPRICAWPSATEELLLKQPNMPLQVHSLSAQRREKQKG